MQCTVDLPTTVTQSPTLNRRVVLSL